MSKVPIRPLDRLHAKRTPAGCWTRSRRAGHFPRALGEWQRFWPEVSVRAADSTELASSLG